MKKIVFLSKIKGLEDLTKAIAGTTVCEVTFTEELAKTVAYCGSNPDVDLVIIQYSLLPLPDKQAAVLRLIRKDHPKVEVWMVSGGMTDDHSRTLIRLGFHKAMWTMDLNKHLHEFFAKDEVLQMAAA